MLAAQATGWQHRDMRRHLVGGLWGLLAVAGCDGGQFGDPPFFDDLTFTEVVVDRRLALRLDDVNLEQRFRLPVTISPPSSSARIDAVFTRVDGVVVGELQPDAFANESPSNWSLLAPGQTLSTFSDGFVEQTYRLSLATNDPPAFVDVRLVVTVPSDVDFDGLDDGVTVTIGAPAPFIP